MGGLALMGGWVAIMVDGWVSPDGGWVAIMVDGWVSPDGRVG